MVKKKFYLTTPIYYVNDLPHIGHAYTTVAADTLSRYKRLAGWEVFFSTGTDEHGQKVQKAAQKEGKNPQDFVDEIAERFKTLWEKLNISYDNFMRTTEKNHKEVVETIMQKLYEKGDIYKGEYKGWYCIYEETFWPENQVVEEKCPECKRRLEKLSETNYFLKLAKYQDWLLKYIEEQGNFIQPVARQHEIVNFIKEGLNDLSISRPKSSFDWGIPLPFDKSQVTYVWIDALINYISTLGYFNNAQKFKYFWPPDLHLIGKDILRPHTVYWLIILKAIGMELPKKVFAHGWWTLKEAKISKSRGNIINPQEIIDRFGVDAFRYFLLREVSFGLDGNFSYEALIKRINSDLANDLGNLLNRTLPMIKKYFQGRIPEPSGEVGTDKELKILSLSILGEVDKFMDSLQFHNALEKIWELVRRTNKYIEENEPWSLKKRKQIKRLSTVLYNASESLRIITILISPFMPGSAEKMWEQLGLQNFSGQNFENIQVWGGLKPETEVKWGEPLFPRIE